MSQSIAASPPRVDLEHIVETPENVVLVYQLAGPATRLTAFFIDFLIRVVIVIGVIILAIGPLQLFGAGFSFGVVLVTWFCVDWVYFGLSEWAFRGKSLGKHILGLRVIHEGGYPITAWGAILRNFVRAGDALPAMFIAFPVYGVGFLTMLAAGKFRRLGDVAARTIVISELPVTLPREPMILETIEPLPRSEISGFVPSPRTLTLIEEFLGRRHVLTYQRGHAMAFVLARALAQRLDFRGDRQLVEKYPMAFLARVFATFHQTLEEETELRMPSRFSSLAERQAELAEAAR